MLCLPTQVVQRLSDRLVFAMIEEHVEENRRVEATWGPWATVGLSMVAGLVQLPIAIFVVILVFIASLTQSPPFRLCCYRGCLNNGRSLCRISLIRSC